MSGRLSAWRQRATRHSSTLQSLVIVATVAVGLGVWIVRRPDQLLHPYVWVEESDILNIYQTHGFLIAALHENSGYFLWPTSFTVALAASLSFLHIPQIDYWLSTAWFLATLLLVLLPASVLRLRWRVGMVLALALAPMGPEIFGIALYTFWWTSLWPLVTIFWSKDYWWLRIPVLILGGMSSLAGAALAVPYAVLWAVTRRRRDLVGTLVLGVTLAVQIPVYLTSHRASQVPFHLSKVVQQEFRNISYYLFAIVSPAPSGFLVFVGACMVLVMAGFVAWSVARRKPNHGELLALFVGLLVIGVDVSHSGAVGIRSHQGRASLLLLFVRGARLGPPAHRRHLSCAPVGQAVVGEAVVGAAHHPICRGRHHCPLIVCACPHLHLARRNGELAHATSTMSDSEGLLFGSCAVQRPALAYVVRTPDDHARYLPSAWLPVTLVHVDCDIRDSGGEVGRWFGGSLLRLRSRPGHGGGISQRTGPGPAAPAG